MIGYMKQLNVTDAECKDVKDHLPMDPTAGSRRRSPTTPPRASTACCGSIYFPKDEDDDIRSKFEYCKRAGI